MEEKKEDLRSEIVALKQIIKNKNKDIETLQKCNETRMKELEELREQFEGLRHTLRESEEYERRLLYTIEELKERLHEREQKAEIPEVKGEWLLGSKEGTATEPGYVHVNISVPINAYKDE